ncbi:unnamed protein product [Merluccius merluccius]
MCDGGDAYPQWTVRYQPARVIIIISIDPQAPASCWRGGAATGPEPGQKRAGTGPELGRAQAGGGKVKNERCSPTTAQFVISCRCFHMLLRMPAKLL